MKVHYKGHGIKGSFNKEVTVDENTEILPAPPADWTYPYEFYKLSFHNKQECHVIVNGENPIYLGMGNGMEFDCDIPVTSFIVVESGIEYFYVGAY